MTKPRLLATLLVLALVGAVASPAGARSSARADRDRVRAKKAQLAKQLDTLNASERQLDGALAALTSQLSSQVAKVASSRQAAAAAQSELAATERKLDDTRAHITVLTSAVVDRAVESFMEPGGNTVDDVVQSRSVNEAARKSALLGQVAANDVDVIDRLKSAQEDLQSEEAAARAARKTASDRQAETERRLRELLGSQGAQRRVLGELDARRKDVLGESAAMDAAYAALSQSIAQQEAALGPGGIVGGGPIGRGGCIWPIRGPVTSEFGNRWGRLHAGIDIGARIGTPIAAAKAGRVVFSGQQSGYGNVVVIDHGGGFTTLYGHQSRLAASVGDNVSQGQVIGYSGNTGHSTGPHLHFETRYGGTPRNPRGCLA
jgi:murein DD-endopeptidase MepM/ murein hydrolase activator NlpD